MLTSPGKIIIWCFCYHMTSMCSRRMGSLGKLKLLTRLVPLGAKKKGVAAFGYPTTQFLRFQRSYSTLSQEQDTFPVKALRTKALLLQMEAFSMGAHNLDFFFKLLMVTYCTLTSSIKLRECFVTKMTRKSCVEQNILWQLQFRMLCRVLLNCSDRHARRRKAEIVAP